MAQKMVRFLLDQEDATKLDIEAKQLGISVSAFIRLLIRNWSNGITFERNKPVTSDPMREA